MEIKEIKQIVDLMKRSDLTEFDIEEKDLKLRIKREGSHSSAAPMMPAAPMPVAQPLPLAQPAATSAATPAAPAVEPGVQYVKSPMVGTFYRAPNPESAPFVDIGAEITPESVVCIIEAMKVMNEIQAEIKGRVLEVLIENGQSVEYGQPLIKVKTQ